MPGGKKRIRDAKQILGWYADSLILHLQNNAGVGIIITGGNTNSLFSVRKGLAGVLHQVDDHLLEALEIPFYKGEILLKIQGKRSVDLLTMLERRERAEWMTLLRSTGWVRSEVSGLT